MKVIKGGRKQTGWAKEFKCSGAGNDDGGCGATLLVEIGDLFKTESHCRDETDTFVTFRCPLCGVETDIPERHYPPQWHALPRKQTWDANRSSSPFTPGSK